MDEASPVTQPYHISKDIRKLTASLSALSELPREAASLLLDHFKSEKDKDELHILASNLRAYKNSTSQGSKSKDVEVSSPKAAVVLREFNHQGKFCFTPL